jgi:HEAT repeat protein
MSAPRETVGGAVPQGADEERRYRAVLEVDVRAPETLDRLLEALADPSWRVRTAVAEKLGEVEPARAAPALVRTLAADLEPGSRNAAASALERLGPAAVAALLPVLERPSPELRTAALEILGQLGDHGATSAVVRRLGDEDPNTRAAAAEALGKIGGADAVAALQATLGSADVGLRRVALDALVRLRVPPAALLLAELMRDRGSRRAALRLAGASDDPAALALLAAGLEDGSRAVREAALAGIGQQRLRPETPAELTAALADAVAAAAARTPGLAAAALHPLGSADARVRAGALALVQWTRAAEHAAAVAAAGEDEQLRPLAVEALAALGPASGPALSDALDRLAPAARIVALSALATLGDARALPELLPALVGEDEALRGAALEALGRLGDVRAVGPIAALLAGDPVVAAGAVTALSELAERGPETRASVVAACRAATPLPATYRVLGRLGDAGDVVAIRAGLRAPHRGTRVAAAGALAALGARCDLESAEVPELLDALDDADAAVRAAAAQAIGALAGGRRGEAPARGTPGRWAEATRALAAALCDEEGVVRGMAALALGRCRAVDYAPHLAALARDPKAPAEAAAAALHALSDMGAADPEILARAVQHADAEVVKEAVRAAATVPGVVAADLLLRAAAHRRWDVRRAAAVALGFREDAALVDPVRQLAGSEQDPLVAEALRAAMRRLEARTVR